MTKGNYNPKQLVLIKELLGLEEEEFYKITKDEAIEKEGIVEQLQEILTDYNNDGSAKTAHERTLNSFIIEKIMDNILEED